MEQFCGAEAIDDDDDIDDDEMVLFALMDE